MKSHQRISIRSYVEPARQSWFRNSFCCQRRFSYGFMCVPKESLIQVVDDFSTRYEFRPRKISEPPQASDQHSSDSLRSGSSSSQQSAFLSPKKRPKPVAEMIEVPFPRVVSTHSYCFICRGGNGTLRSIPWNARLQVFIARRIIIPQTIGAVHHSTKRQVL